MNIEEHLQRHLETYLNEGRKDHSNGVSHVQRTCRIGYNQACHMVERGLEQGVLVRDTSNESLHRIAKSRAMGREIKFRGLSTNKEWLYGSLYVRMEGAVRCAYIMNDDFEPVTVYQETTGQFTGLQDKNGTDIYEGNIVRWGGDVIETVRYDDSLTSFVTETSCLDSCMEVIGNIHENPELLGGGS